MKRAITSAIAVALLASSGVAYANNHAGAAAAIAAAVADDRRPEADVARDPLRKPAEITHFAGVEPGMTIAEIAPGGGYYTRVLAASVGPQGKVYALMPSFFASRLGGLDAINALAAEYGNVEVIVVEGYDALSLPEQVDLVWTTENYHDLANGDIGVVNAGIDRVLKPGGIYFVEDHSAPGTGLSATSTIHRIDPMAVIGQVTSAGFVLEATSDLLLNPDDPRDVNPREAQPTSEKFALRFRKPE
ncbi:methyltransferase domain-containing protein [Altererythrobacter sp. KTW20L]|uniref:class I SAM-dependent methyltransferase n=1 Tax=Altererythrobacter sp. KTW20L TaxID=2942210 RepID=UPI0020C17238|nr:methyltransferase domain-containing protein [Altererythrobacter sp. KTW20L]MCL6251374.1 methyltransferase domain-containing protein [Altererythrobacter sp. KTW20L]